MAAQQVRILRRTTITVPNLSGSQSLTWPPLIQLVSGVPWVSGALLVSVYQNNLTSTGGTPRFNLALVNVDVSADDPAVMLPPNDALSSVDIDFGVSAPTLLLQRVPSPQSTSPIGRQVSAYLTVQANGATATGGDLTIAVDVVFRDA